MSRISSGKKPKKVFYVQGTIASIAISIFLSRKTRPRNLTVRSVYIFAKPTSYACIRCRWITLVTPFASLGTRLSPRNSRQECHKIAQVKRGIQTLFSASDKYRSDLSCTEGKQLNETRVQSDFRETVTESTMAKSYLSFCGHMYALQLCARAIISERD